MGDLKTWTTPRGMTDMNLRAKCITKVFIATFHILPNTSRHSSPLSFSLDLGRQHKHCELAGCACHIPLEHHSYIHDIQRRVEPMVTSLVNLEHQVAKLMHHIGGGEHPVPQDEMSASKRNAGSERFAIHDDGLSHYKNDEKHEAKGETLARLEAQIRALMHQMHEVMADDEKGNFIRNA